MIRRILSRLLVVAPPGWSLIAFLIVFASTEGPILYFERQVGQVLDLPFRPGRWCLIAGCVLLAGYRVGAFHPYFHRDYLRWLKATPWTVAKPLPVGPVELVPQDAPAVGALMLLSLTDPQTDSVELLNVFLFAHSVGIVRTFWWTGAPGFGYCAALVLGFVPRLWASPWLALAVLTSIYIPVHEGLWRSLSRFPWPSEGLASDVNTAMRQEREFGPPCGWPHDRFLRDVKTAEGIGRTDALLISMLIGWWVSSLEAWISPRFLGQLVGFTAMSVMGRRAAIYFRGYAPPMSLAGRITSFRWIIPGYDQAFLAFILPMLAFPAVLLLVRSLGMDPRQGIPVLAALVVLFTLTTPPSLRAWRLTGRHRLVAAIPKASQEFVQVG